MRLLFTTFLAFVSLVLFSQSPEKINYQSIVRDLAGNVIQNQPISLRISILSDSINGTIVYQETFQPTTNNFGLVNIKIGDGTPVIATMSSVDWSNGPFFLESAVDVTGGTNYIVVSTSQFMSVPYALYAGESPLDTSQVQNIVNQQTNNFLDSTSIQNMIDSSVLNIDSTLIASWGYIDSSSIMILINNNSLDSTTIQNMIDNSIVNIDSSTVASWGYLDSSTIQILINNSTIDSSSVSNWGFLDSTTIQNIITQQTNNYLDSSSVQNMIDNSVTNIDSSTVASWGYIDSSSIMILINNNSLDSAAIQNMINSSITNVDSSTVASWGYLDSSSIIALISNSNIDSSSVANWGYLDSVSIQNMINNSSVNVDSAMIANFGYVAGPHTIDTDTQIDSAGIANLGYVAGPHTIDTDTQIDSTGIANLGYVAGPHTIDTDTDTQIDSAGIAAMGYLDSVSIRNMIDSAVAQSSSSSGSGSGSSLTFPDGINNFTSLTQGFPSDYTVPSGKNLYVTNVLLIGSFEDTVYINNNPIYTGKTFGGNQTQHNKGDIGQIIDNPLILGPGDVIKIDPVRSYQGFTGFLIDADVDPVTIALNNTQNSTPSFTVPLGKIFVLLNVYNHNLEIKKNGITFLRESYNSQAQSTSEYKLRTLSMPVLFSQGDILSHNGSWSARSKATLNGYLVDSDFFESYSSSSGSGSNSTIDSTTVANWGFSTDTDTQIDSTGIANLGYVAGTHTIDTDTQIDSAGIAGYGYVAGPHTIDNDTQIDSAGIAALGYVAGPKTIDTDTQLDSAGIANLGYVAGPHTVDTDTQIDSTGIAALGYVAGPKTIDTDTQLDSAGIANLGYVAGPHTVDTQIDSAGIANYGFIDSVTVMNMINQYSTNSSNGSSSGNGNSFIFPEGYNGIPITHFFGNGSYTVPTGKSLYVTIRYSASGDLKINNTTVSSGTNNYGGGSLGLLLPLILNSGDILSSTSSNSSFHGFLVDENLSSITHSFGLGNYTVPSDKTLYILNRYSNNGDLKINGTTVLAQTNNAGGGSAGLLLPVIVSAGDVVSSTNSSTSFNGYLADTSYFESSGSNVDSAAISDMGFVDSSAVQNMIDLNENSFEISKIFPDSGYCSNTSNNSPCVNYSDALIYCDTLSENGNDDWFLPSLYELSNSTSGGSVIPDYRTTDYMWSTTPVGGSYASYVQALKLLGSGNSVMRIQSFTYTLIGVRCIRKKKLNTTNSSSGSGSNANTLIFTTNGF